MIFCVSNNATDAHLSRLAIEPTGDPQWPVEALGRYTEECRGHCANDPLPVLDRAAPEALANTGPSRGVRL